MVNCMETGSGLGESALVLHIYIYVYVSTAIKNSEMKEPSMSKDDAGSHLHIVAALALLFPLLTLVMVGIQDCSRDCSYLYRASLLFIFL